jgi:hypothetical protein
VAAANKVAVKTDLWVPIHLFKQLCENDFRRQLLCMLTGDGAAGVHGDHLANQLGGDVLLKLVRNLVLAEMSRC